ncbi:MAG: universal stress protein [Bacteroidetes bacterium]|nr:universal stress protein [Bacteroidota bacterium]
MKKIIAAFDGLRFSDSTLQYAIHLAEKSNAHLVGVFLQEATQLGYAVYATLVSQTLSGNQVVKEIDKTDAATIDKAIETFESKCKKAGINYSVHRSKKSAPEELIHESIFADLLVIDAWETFSYIETNLPEWFVQNILHHAQCPVMVVPKKFNPIKRTVLLYDGSNSAMHAIKMYNYIVPGTASEEIKLLCAKSGSSSLHLPDNKLLKEWMKRHYSKIDYHVLKGDEKEIVTILKNEVPGTLVVAGAYNRSNFSMWFHKSIADLLIHEIKAPIFIAHA